MFSFESFSMVSIEDQDADCGAAEPIIEGNDKCAT